MFEEWSCFCGRRQEVLCWRLGSILDKIERRIDIMKIRFSDLNVPCKIAFIGGWLIVLEISLIVMMGVIAGVLA